MLMMPEIDGRLRSIRSGTTTTRGAYPSRYAWPPRRIAAKPAARFAAPHPLRFRQSTRKVYVNKINAAAACALWR